MIFHDQRSGHKVRSGFTILEVLIVVVLIGILAVLASVSWRRITYKLRVVTAVEELRNAVQLARSDAVTRRRHSGLLLDVSARKYLRFVDSSKLTQLPDGTYTTDDPIVIQDWVELPSRLVFHSVASSFTPRREPRNCGASRVAVSTTTRAGPFYPIVFRPDGSSWATFDARLGVESFPGDTLRLTVFPPTGLVQLEK